MSKKPVSGKALREAREEGYIIELEPSGTIVKLRPVQLDVLLLAGKIPNHLTAIVSNMIWEKLGYKVADTSIDDKKQHIEFVNCIASVALLEPRVVDNPQADDEIKIEDLPFCDRIMIATYAQQPAEVLRYFRDKQARDVEALSANENDTQQTERVNESQESD